MNIQYLQVKLINGYPRPLWYTGSPGESSYPVGTLVRVPLQKRVETAYVCYATQEKPAHITFELKAILHKEALPEDALYRPFIQKIASYYQIDPIILYKRLTGFLGQEHETELSDEQQSSHHQSAMLTNEQSQAATFFVHAIDRAQFQPIVLHGVTGSGKTEVYKTAIQHTLAQNKSVILMLPEVTLAHAFEQRLKKELPQHTPIFGFHSATKQSEKKALWAALQNNQSMLIIGVHLPILLPISNLGCIIIDEEHEVGYQEKKHPKINSKEAALIRAQLYNIPIMLGSATPSIATLHAVTKKQWPLFKLTKRFAGAFPAIVPVLLTDKKERKNFWISTQLLAALKDRIAKKEQSIIFINRRGYSFFVQCKRCSHIFGCPACSVSLTLHADGQLNCHYCSYSMMMPRTCTQCSASSDDLIKKGVGTEQMVNILQSLLPSARIVRADQDVTRKKKLWAQTLSAIEKQQVDIIVGTQTITKGYHFPKVTLVGVIWADLNLHFPMYNASEVTLAQLIQVAGRAGRQTQESTVIIQAMAHHPIFDYIDELKYPEFYEKEIATRAEVGYPPCKRLAQIELRASDEAVLQADADMVCERALEYIERHNMNVLLLGPAKPPVHKIKHTHIMNIYLKADQMSEIIAVYQHIAAIKCAVEIFFTPNVQTSS